jgi:voltage-gated potassium channel
LDELDVSVRRRLIARSAVVSLTVVTAVVGAYLVSPWDTEGTSSVAVRVVISVAILVAGTLIATTHVLRAEYPVLRAVQSLVAIVTFAIVTFASIHLLLSTNDAAAFSEPLDRIDALYFAMTTATTIGYGDIHAQSDAARVVVMIQMVTNVVILGAAARVLLNTARRRIDR